MKKLMVAMTITSLIGIAQADLTSTRFESPYTVGALDTTKDDSGNSSGQPGFSQAWVALPAGDDGSSKITAWESKPAAFADAVGSNYLYVETGSTNLERLVQYGGGTTNISDGIYLDTLVKFTASEELFNDNELGSADKLAIQYVATENGEISNIVVRAGYVDGSTIVATNYIMIMNSQVDINPDDWYQLTVRAIANTGSSVAPVGFAIYINGELLVYDVNQDAGDSTYQGAIAGNSTIATYLYNSSKHAFLPSLVRGSLEGAESLTSVGFKGTGCIDNIAFLDKPPFDLGEGTSVTIEWQEGIDTYTVNDGVTSFTVDVTGSGLTNITFGTSIKTITVTATYDNGYKRGSWTATNNGLVGDVWTIANNAKLTMGAMLPKFKVGDNEYGTFTEALAAAVAAGSSSPVTIKLLGGVSETMSFTEGNIILDLCGQTISAGANAKFVIANQGATLKIVDTATGGIVGAGSTGSVRVYGDTAFTTIEAGTYQGTIVFAGQESAQLGDLLVVNGGKFYDSDYAEESSDTFYLTAYVDTTTYTITGPDAQYYFTVGGEEPAEPTCWADVLGDAAQDGAYEIDDLAELKDFQKYVGAVSDGKFATAGLTFRLTGNITLDEAWEGIGIKGGKDLVNGGTKDIPTYEAGAFCGTFDGQNHTISNFQMENGTDYGAFFNSVNSATISNLKITFKEGKLCADSSSTGGDTGATFVGVARGSTLLNLTALATESVTTVSASKDMAGIVGYLMAGSTVDSCTNELNVASLLTAKARKSGGIALITQDGSGTATIRNCKNSGTVTLANAGGQLGGIVGYVGTTTAIADCENTAAVKMVTHMSGTLTMSGVNKGNATVESCNKAIDGLNFATVDNGVATFVADNALALNGSYKVMATGATATFAFAEAGTIAFDTNLVQAVTFNITAGVGINEPTPATENGVVTYTATAQGGGSADWDENPSEIADNKSASEEYPALAGSSLATADAKKLTVWAKANSVDFADVAAATVAGNDLESAYLLNCAPAEVEDAKAAFKFTSISYDATSGKWVTPTTESYNGKGYNGTITVKQYSDVGCTTESESGTFFRAELGF